MEKKGCSALIFSKHVFLCSFRIGKLNFDLFYGDFCAFTESSGTAAGEGSPFFAVPCRKISWRVCSSNVQLADYLVRSLKKRSFDLITETVIFVDGYVCQDEGTGKPGTVLPDSTWNWGYHFASQYDAENQTLTFRKYVQVRQESLEKIGGRTGVEHESDRTDEHCGLEVAVEIPLAEVFAGDCSLSAGWQWIPAWREHSEFSSFRQDYLYTSRLYYLRSLCLCHIRCLNCATRSCSLL